MTTTVTRLITWLHGAHVGADVLGNQYFTEKRTPKARRAKRWVVYKGEAEPSKVPPEWHGWLHYTTDALPTTHQLSHHGWQKKPQPNLSGTPAAYVPPGHLMRGGKRAASIADYKPWKPE